MSYRLFLARTRRKVRRLLNDVPSIAGEFRTDRLLLGSDWPHAEGTREPLEFVTDTLARLPADEVQRIARDNAVELLGVSV